MYTPRRHSSPVHIQSAGSTPAKTKRRDGMKKLFLAVMAMAIFSGVAYAAPGIEKVKYFFHFPLFYLQIPGQDMRAEYFLSAMCLWVPVVLTLMMGIVSLKKSMGEAAASVSAPFLCALIGSILGALINNGVAALIGMVIGAALGLLMSCPTGIMVGMYIGGFSSFAGLLENEDMVFAYLLSLFATGVATFFAVSVAQIWKDHRDDVRALADWWSE